MDYRRPIDMSTVNGGWRGQNIVKDGLILYIDAGSPNSYYPPNSGTSWRDISGRGNNGTLTNGPTFNSSNGGSIVFDGLDDYTLISPSTELASIQVPMSIMGWYWDNGTKPTPTIFSQYLNTTPGNLVKLVRVQSGILTYFTSRAVAPGFQAFQLTGTTSQFNTWNFFAITTSGTLASHTITLTLNTTTSTFSGTIMANPNTTVEVRFGAAQSTFQSSNEFLAGRIGEIFVYNKTLTSTEISQNYNATRGRFGV